MNRYTSIIVQTESNVKLACILPLRNRKSRLDALISREGGLVAKFSQYASSGVQTNSHAHHICQH